MSDFSNFSDECSSYGSESDDYVDENLEISKDSFDEHLVHNDTLTSKSGTVWTVTKTSATKTIAGNMMKSSPGPTVYAIQLVKTLID
mgnify:CR=1 FL=1